MGTRGGGGEEKDELKDKEKEEGKSDQGNIFDRMKKWKKAEETKEENAWEKAIVSLEDFFENGEQVGDEKMELEALEALEEVVGVSCACGVVCVCVRVCERDRERACVCVCVCMLVHVWLFLCVCCCVYM